MPEAAEVELMRRMLGGVDATRLARVIRQDPDLDCTLDTISDASVVGVRRLGKRIAIDLEGGRSPAFHPRMTGAIKSVSARARPQYLRAILEFDGYRFAFVDRRRLGSLSVIESDAFESGYGIDLLMADEESLESAAEVSSKRRRTVKALMLDQTGPVCGAGNYLVDETLFALGTHPATAADDLDREGWRDLWTYCQTLARRSLSGRPALLADYIAPPDAVGRQDNVLVCYGREGLPCVECRMTLVRIRVANRGTTICPQCQALDTGRSPERHGTARPKSI